MQPFSITSRVTKYPTQHPYEQIKNDILGKKYSLSVAFVGATTAQKLNVEHRKKTYVPNVLSFGLTNDTGEIFITPAIAKKEAKKFAMTIDGYIGFLFVHALLHLKGLDHGDTMEKAEKKYCSKYHLQ